MPDILPTMRPLVGVVWMLAVATVTVGTMTAGIVLPAAADDDALTLHREPIEFTDVADAFDGEDPFDLNVTVGFHHLNTSGLIQRESNQPSALDGRASANYVDLADYTRTVNRLDVQVEAGVFRDLSLTVGLPILLGDGRELTVPNGRTPAQASADAAQFQVPFVSPSRSGLDHLALGLKWGIFNQMRDPEYPTWLLMLGARLGIGTALTPCRDGTTCDPGASQGTNALRLETRMSRRLGVVEPYAGLAFDIAWPGSASDAFEPGGSLDGFLNSIPPRVGEFTVGAAVIPWQHRGRFQRLVIDFRFTGAYVSEGHTYSPLFDALGTSTDASLTQPIAECPGCGRQVPFTGLTDVQSHGRLVGNVAVEMQASRNLRFRVGAGLGWDSPHLLTFADACNGSVTVPTDDPRRGNCRQGIINPHHRTTIDLPGSRFRSAGELTLDLFVRATGQF